MKEMRCKRQEKDGLVIASDASNPFLLQAVNK